MSFVFLTPSVLLIVIAISAFIINNLKNQIHNLKIAFNNLEREKKILENELEIKKNDLEIELFESQEKKKIVLSHRELLKSKVLSQVVSTDFLNENIDNNECLFFCVCLRGDKAGVAFMLNSYPDELKNKRVLHKARGLVEKSQTILNKKAMLGLLRKAILLITYPTK